MTESPTKKEEADSHYMTKHPKAGPDNMEPLQKKVYIIFCLASQIAITKKGLTPCVDHVCFMCWNSVLIFIRIEV